MRKGLNCRLAYAVGSTTYQMDVRVTQLYHGNQMVADESESRQRRAYYPHRLSAAPFTLNIVLKGYTERILFSNFINDYAGRALDPSLDASFPAMAVIMPVRNFFRMGVPLNGIDWGTAVGAMVWNSQVTFETTFDKGVGDDQTTPESFFELDPSASKRVPELKYFYPSGIQLSGDQVPPPGDYTKQMTIQDITNIINGGTSGPSDPGSTG